MYGINPLLLLIFLKYRLSEFRPAKAYTPINDAAGCTDDWVISHNKILLCLAKPVSSVLWTSVLASSSTYGLDLLLIHICQTQTKYHQILRWKCCPVFYIFLFKGTAGCSSVQSVQKWVVIYRISGSLSVLVRVAPLK